MIWREASTQDTGELIRLSQEPMGGRIKLIWGFTKLQAPHGCSDFMSYVAKEEDGICGTAHSWRWPEGSRYLSGLRFHPGMRTRPGPNFWKRAYEHMLANVDLAWTCIGDENARARRILESGASWLPGYQPRQKIRTWFVPFSRSAAGQETQIPDSITLHTAEWRHVAIASGAGWAFRMGRLLQRLGLPGAPTPGKQLKIAYFHPAADYETRKLKQAMASIRGYDGLVVVLPKDSNAADLWQETCPRSAWTWDSTLYAVSWSKSSALDAPIPHWKGLWL